MEGLWQPGTSQAKISATIGTLRFARHLPVAAGSQNLSRFSGRNASAYLGKEPKSVVTCAKYGAVIAWLRLLLASVLILLPFSCSDSAVRPLRDTGGSSQDIEVEVLVVNLTGVLGTQEIALSVRALREAEERGQQVVFRMNTAGGMAESSSDVHQLLDIVQDASARVSTTAVLQGKVFGGAAYLALLCDRVYFLRGGEIGAVTPMPTTWQQLQELTDENAERARYTAYGEEMLQRLERRRSKFSADAVKLCQGMADPLMQLLRVRLRERGIESERIIATSDIERLQAAGATITGKSEVTKPVVLTADEAEEYGISRGVLQSMEQLCTDELLVDERLVGELQYSWSESMVGWLELLQPGLLILGFVLLLLEVKTPGLGLPGLLGVVFLAMAMFYSYLVGLAEVTEIILFFLGIIALVVEIFVLPGVIVFGAVGFICLVLSLILSRQTFVLPSSVSEQDILFWNLMHLAGLFVAVLVVAGLLWRVLPRIPLLNRIYLDRGDPHSASGSAVALPPGKARGADLQRASIGAVGTAVTVLRPAGTMAVDGQHIDVVTDGDYVAMGDKVRVIEVHGNRVVVEPANEEHAGSGPSGAESGSVGIILLLCVLFLVFAVAEVFFVSFGVLFTLSGLSLFGAVFLAFQEGGAFGVSVLVGAAIGGPAAIWGAFRVLPKTPMGRALMLKGPATEDVTGGATDPDIDGLMDQRGMTLSMLRPAGFARIAGRKVDVVTRGEMIGEGCEVRVVEVMGNRVVVRTEPQ